MTFTSRLIHRLEPYADESVVGFLMRMAYKNGLNSPSVLLQFLTGSSSTSPLYKDIPRIAYFCRNSPDEILQLSGFEQWTNTEPRWLVQQEWITKSVFIQSRVSKICPFCIKNAPYLRALWNLTFYTHCAWHGCVLIDRCPNCRKSFKWDRRRPEYCECNQHLGIVDPEFGQTPTLLLSKALAYRVSQDYSLIENVKNKDAIEKLLGLSLDGICKTVWFLGYCLPELGKHSVGHGRKKPSVDTLDKMVLETFRVLQDWPLSIGQVLNDIVFSELSPDFSAVAFHYLLRPLDHYLKTSFDSHELMFIRRLYEQHLESLWLSSGKKNSGSRYEKQFRLDF